MCVLGTLLGKEGFLVRPTTISLACLMVIGSAVSEAAEVITITACGQTVAEGAVAQLTQDMDCSAFSADSAVVLKHRARLQLAGHVLTGNPTVDAVVGCSNSCAVDGPGTVTGGAWGVRAVQGNANVTDITITGAFYSAVRSDFRGAKITGATIVGNGGAVNVEGRARITDSAISNNAYGVGGSKLRIIDSTISNNTGDGVWGDVSKVFGSTIMDNSGAGVGAFGRATVTDSTIAGNGLQGVNGTRAKVVRTIVTNSGGDGVLCQGGNCRVGDSTIVGNGEAGVATSRNCRVTDSTITGNGSFGVSSVFRMRISGQGAVESNCTTVTSACADVRSGNRPVVSPPATCGTSVDFFGASWGVCTLDP